MKREAMSDDATTDTQADLPGVSESKTETTDADARIRAAEAKAAKLEAAEKKRKAKEADEKRKAEEADAKKRGDYEKLLADKDERLAAAEQRIKAIEEATAKRVEGKLERLAKLSEAAAAEIAVIREDLSPERLEELLDMKLSATTQASTQDDGESQSGERLPPPTGAPAAPTRRPKDNHTPTAMAAKILDEMSLEHDYLARLRTLEVRRGDADSGGNAKFSMAVKNFYREMKTPGGSKLSREEAERRRR